MLELNDLIGGVALDAPAVADSLISSLYMLFSAGMPNGLGPGELAVGAGAGAVAGVGSTYGPPLPPMSSTVDRQFGQYRYRDSGGNGYWPGISAVPDDGIVYQREGRFNNDLNRRDRGGGWHPDPLPVDRGTGRVIYPPPGNFEGTAALTSAGRG